MKRFRQFCTNLSSEQKLGIHLSTNPLTYTVADLQSGSERGTVCRP